MIANPTYDLQNLKELMSIVGIADPVGLEYQDLIPITFKDVQIIQKRILVDLAILRSIQNSDVRKGIKEWIKERDLIELCNEKELNYLNNKDIYSLKIYELAAYLDEVYLLAWAIDCIDSAPDHDSGLSITHMDALYTACPNIMDDPMSFLNTGKSINKEKVFFHKQYYDYVLNYLENKISKKEWISEKIDIQLIRTRVKILNWITDT